MSEAILSRLLEASIQGGAAFLAVGALVLLQDHGQDAAFSAQGAIL